MLGKPEVYSTNNGLPQSSVYGILQAKNGFVWLATGNGICRFDGREWKVYKNNFSYKGKPASNLFNSDLYEDSKGTIWCCNVSGTFYIPKQGNALQFYCAKNDTAAYFSTTHIALENGNTVWITNYAGELIRYDVASGSTAIYSFKNFIAAKNPATSVVMYAKGKVYIGIFNKILVFDKAEKLFSEVVFNHKGYDLSLSMIEINGDIYFTSLNGLFSLKGNTCSRVNIPVKESIKRIYNNTGNSFFISTVSNTFYVYSIAGNTVSAQKISEGEAKQSVEVNCLYTDKNNNLWLGTEGSGVLKYDLKSSSALFHINKENNGISSNFIKGILKYNNDVILIGTSNAGLNVYNRATRRNKVLFNDKNISYIYKDRKNRIWMGCDHSIYLSNGDLNFKPVTLNAAPAPDLSASYLFTITESPNGTVYFGTTSGLLYYNEQAAEIRFVAGASYNLSVYFINDSTALVSQYDGILCIRHISADKTKVRSEPININARNPRYILPDGQDVIWLATENGLVKYNLKTHLATTYNQNNGLNNEFLYAALPDDDGNIWVSTNGGISVFNKQTERFRNIDISCGLQSTEYNTGSYYRAPDGELFFGGINGLNYFYPKKLVPDTTAPLQAITGIRIYEHALNIDSVLQKQNTLRVAYNQNSIYIQFAALDFTAPEKNRFAFWLEGQDQSWSDIGTTNFVRFSALQPGEYKLWLKSANRDGIWGKPQHMLTIIISPPFWQTWWFITLLLLGILALVAGVVYGVTRSRYRKRMAMMEREKAVQNIRLQLSQDIHDDIGGNLSMIALLSDRLSGSAAPAEAEQLLKMGQLARTAQRGFRELIWSVNPVHDNLENFIYYLRNYATDFFEKTPIETHFIMPDKVPAINLLPNVRRNVFLVYKEALNNIIKHSGATAVTITIKALPGQLVVIVKDNGKGIAPQTIKGNGLQNFEFRMEKIDGSFELESLADNGVCLTFSAPLN